MTKLVIGVNAIYESLRMRPEDVVQIVMSQGRTMKNLDKVIELARNNRIPIVEKNKHGFMQWINSLQKGHGKSLNHQGVAAEIKSRLYQSLDELLERINKRDKPALLLVLDEITDPHNLGALIRTAACAGVDGVIIPKRGAASINATVTKVAAGGTEHITICRVNNINYMLAKLRDMGFQVCGLSADTDQVIYDVDLTGNSAIVVGSEQRGLRPLVAKNCTSLASIPMLTPMESLNASVAGGIAIYEVVRARLKNQ